MAQRVQKGRKKGILSEDFLELRSLPIAFPMHTYMIAPYPPSAASGTRAPWGLRSPEWKNSSDPLAGRMSFIHSLIHSLVHSFIYLLKEKTYSLQIMNASQE